MICSLLAVFTKSLCHIIEVLGRPLIQSQENKQIQNREKIQELKARKAQLQEKLALLESQAKAKAAQPSSPGKVTSV